MRLPEDCLAPPMHMHLPAAPAPPRPPGPVGPCFYAQQMRAPHHTPGVYSWPFPVPFLAPPFGPSPCKTDVRLRLLGAHQLDNAAAAVAAAAQARRCGLERIDLQSVAAGLEAAQLPGRFQVCQFAEDAEAAAAAAALKAQGGSADSTGGMGASQGPWVVLDGAHTAESARALAQTLREVFPTAPVALVLAMAEDKQHRCACALLQRVVAMGKCRDGCQLALEVGACVQCSAVLCGCMHVHSKCAYVARGGACPLHQAKT